MVASDKSVLKPSLLVVIETNPTALILVTFQLLRVQLAIPKGIPRYQEYLKIALKTFFSEDQNISIKLEI